MKELFFPPGQDDHNSTLGIWRGLDWRLSGQEVLCYPGGDTQCVPARRVSLYLLDPEEIWELNYATVSIVFLPVATSYLW